MIVSQKCTKLEKFHFFSPPRIVVWLLSLLSFFNMMVTVAVTVCNSMFIYLLLLLLAWATFTLSAHFNSIFYSQNRFFFFRHRSKHTKIAAEINTLRNKCEPWPWTRLRLLNVAFPISKYIYIQHREMI